MKLSTPRWWYVETGVPAPMTRLLLTPASWIWRAATARRIARGAYESVGVPVICIGNLTMGGAGKTPVARAVLDRLAAAGRRPCLLSRGHGGRLGGPVLVGPAVHTAAEVGDEPLMVARDHAVVVSRDRAAGARLAVERGFDVVVMDDGHQNPALNKTLSLVVVDGETRDEWPFGDGKVFPVGPMREPLAVGLARADAVILLLPADLPAPEPRLLALLNSKPVLIARLSPARAAPEGPYVGFAGIGKPWKFERALKAAGVDLADFAPFPDHAEYSRSDLTFLAERAAQFEAKLITTEKDLARLPAEWRARVEVWPVGVTFDDEAALRRLLDGVV